MEPVLIENAMEFSISWWAFFSGAALLRLGLAAVGILLDLVDIFLDWSGVRLDAWITKLRDKT